MFIILFLLVFVAHAGGNLCEKCFCAYEGNIPLLQIDCSRLDLLNPMFVVGGLIGSLDFSHNKISILNSSISSKTIQNLDLSYNKIQQISPEFFCNISGLSELNLGHNQLENLDSLEGLTNLKVLNLQWNKLVVLPEKILLNMPLDTLTLSYNNLGKFVEENGLDNYVPSTINSIYAERIHLTKLDSLFVQNIHLKKLSVAHNPIQNLVYLPLNYLEYLDISGTFIGNISAGSLSYHNMKILKMNRLSRLRQISDYAFYNLQNLRELYIEHCVNLNEFSPLAFGYKLVQNSKEQNYTIEKFSLAHSGLITLPKSFQSLFENMQEIHLKGNFWRCDCNLSWFKYLKKNVKDINQIRCSSPESEANKTVHEIAENLTCIEVKKLKNPSPYRPTQTFLFPLVGVLAIIVIILVSILIYMGPNHIYPNKQRYIGPDSPYNPITIQPNQAEYYFNNNNIHSIS